ncbi:hypothetical protein PIB30_048744 [Stylosanthes scabra]|uniref:RRM domain-containing protein n=1 Tax=Stylosanthes scabra TaxID=79078 RepID=A0ABU6ZFV4_9FABA|nr:hypothetical protein [Stylosanthes scabra]
MREEGGVRRVTRVERGKHGEVSGQAGRRNKGERGVGFVSGDRRFTYWDGERGTEREPRRGFTVFVDNLPMDVLKRALFKEFGRSGFITDIYVSRKYRRNFKGAFAFIRYNEYGGALRSVSVMNGTMWGNAKLLVTMSKYGRGMITNKGKGENGVGVKQRVSQRWVEPIEFRKVMNKLLDEWNGPGEIDCRDVGPHKDGAFQNELLMEVFDEVRPHWELFWNSSRRVWLEIMGMPVPVWSTENFTKIAKKWGKVEDKILEVFVKEFGAEVYSVSSHPNLVSVSESSDLAVTENSLGPREEGALMEDEVEPTEDVSMRKRGGIENLNSQTVMDPLIEEIIKSKLRNEHLLNMEREVGGEVGEAYEGDEQVMEDNYGRCFSNGGRLGLLGCDPATHEAQIMKKESSKKTVENKKLIDGNKVHRLSGPTESGSSCPFPPGFGPCTGRTHVHHDRIRSKIPNCDGEGVHLSCGVGSSEVGDSDETRYKINEAAFKDVADGDRYSASWSADVLIDGKEQCVVVGPDTNGEGVVDGQALHVNLGE